LDSKTHHSSQNENEFIRELWILKPG